MNEITGEGLSGEAMGSMADRSRIVYEFTRAASLDGWWAWVLVLLGCAAALWLSSRLYRRDAGELPQGVRWTLVAMRLTVIAGLIFFFFDLQRRTQRMVTRPSEVVILADTSQSMSLPSGPSPQSPTRVRQAVSLLGESDLVRRLAREHRATVYAFDEEPQPRLLESRGGDVIDDAEGSPLPPAGRAPGPAEALALFGLVCLGASLLLTVGTLLIAAGGRGDRVGWLLFACGSCLVLGIVSLGGVYAVDTDRPLSAIVGVPGRGAEASEASGAAEAAEASEEGERPIPDESPPLRVGDWSEALAAAGTQSRIGDAIRSVLVDHDPTTLAGIVVLTDGQNNGGVDLGVAAAAARRNQVPLYPIGLGSSTAPVNVRVVDIDAPRRVYPGDRFAVSAVLQASGPAPITVEVQLLDALDEADSGGADSGGLDSGGLDSGGGDAGAGGDGEGPTAGVVVDSRQVTLEPDGTLSGVRFELEPESVGRRRLTVRAVPPPEDRNPEDDARQARYEVVARKLRVLAVAGGPTREYRFVRNLLYRDNSVELDVWLQTGESGISQDADRTLFAFPGTAEELFEYDAVMMFDPDWLGFSADDLELLDRWLTQQAGGMILVAGPVHHPEWTRMRTDPRVGQISGFFPVNVATRGPLLDGGRQGGDTPWPLEFTDEAARAEFLWITEEPQSSREAWADFAGVFDFVGVRDPKPGAKVYARFSDPTTEIGGDLPVFLASQFYGAGRIFFQASGEMWRLRGVDDGYFDSYYTKLVRWVSEGRLLRDSTRGVLLVDNPRAMVGDTIAVRAVLSDDQFEPLELPEVRAKLLLPGGRIDELPLRPLQGEPRPGTYGGRFAVREAGSYELRLTIGDALNEQVLRQSVQVRLPAIELERPQRNDAELTQLATVTSGEYLPLDDEATAAAADRLVSLIRPQPQTAVLPGSPDRDFHERRNAVLMWLLASALTLEWVTRRLHRLA